MRRAGLSTCSAPASRPCPAPTGSPRATATPSPPHDVEQLGLRGAARELPQGHCGSCRTQQPKKKNIIVRIFFLKMHTYLFTQRLRLSCSNFSSGFDPPWLRVKRIIPYEKDRYNHNSLPLHSWLSLLVSFSYKCLRLTVNYPEISPVMLHKSWQISSMTHPYPLQFPWAALRSLWQSGGKRECNVVICVQVHIYLIYRICIARIHKSVSKKTSLNFDMPLNQLASIG